MRIYLMITALSLLLPAAGVAADDAGLSIPAETKTIGVDKDDGKTAKVKTKSKSKKTSKKKKKSSGYRFEAQDKHQYRYDKNGKPLTGKKASSKKKKAASGDSGYKFKQEKKGSAYKFDEEANPIEKAKAGKPAPKKPAAKPKSKETPPPYDDSLAVDKKVISLEGE